MLLPLRDRTSDRAGLIERLKVAGVGHRIYFTPTLIEQPAFAEFRPADRLPAAERYSREALAIPMGPDLGPQGIGEVVSAARSAFAPSAPK